MRVPTRLWVLRKTIGVFFMCGRGASRSARNEGITTRNGRFVNRPYYNVTTKTLVLRVILSVEKHKVFFGVEVLRRRSKTEERSDEGIY